jgi:DNA-binding phage protein
MTDTLRKRLTASKDRDAFEKLDAVLAEDERGDADLEYMLSLVRTLREVAGTAGARGLTRKELDRLDEAISDGVADSHG